MHRISRGIFVILIFASGQASLLAYAPTGHEIAGAIADERLAGTPTAAKIAVLLDGLRLEKAPVIADEIKGWDKKGVDDPRSFHTRRIGISTGNCVSSGAQISRRMISIRPCLHTTGSLH
jgi:hypothetical protein